MNESLPEAQFENPSVGTKATGKIRKVIVDRPACIGARSCVLVAPKTFQMDDENLAYVVKENSTYEDDETIKMAAEACPVLAIHLYDENNKKLFPET